MSSEDDFTPKDNAEYCKQEYWEERFKREAAHDWLAAYADVRHLVNEMVPDRDSKVLLVGCGNSPFTASMRDDGYTSLTSTDYSEAVIERMRARYAESHPEVRWAVADMRDLRAYDAGSFDVVIDKAALDAIMADEGDPWDPKPTTREAVREVCEAAQRVLHPGGLFVQITFQQPHFRRRYLAHHAWESITVRNIDKGFGYYFIVARTLGAAQQATVE